MGDDRRPAVWLSIVLIAIGILGCFTSTAFCPLALHMTAQNPSGLTVLHGIATLVADVVLPVWLLWRHRQPFTITLVTAAISLVLPIGNTVPLIALACLLGRRRGAAPWWTTAAVTITTTIVGVVDAARSPKAASTIKTLLSPANTPDTADLTVSWFTVAAFIAAGLIISIGSGLWRRSQRTTTSLTRERDVAQATNAKLGDELSRREERERIAQEIHDQLGHRLSLLSLQSGALETQLRDNPDAVKAAHEVQAGAAAAVNDLHSLLSVLTESRVTPDLPLSKLAEVIDESFGAGQPLNSSVFIEDADRSIPPCRGPSTASFRSCSLTQPSTHPGRRRPCAYAGIPETESASTRRTATSADGLEDRVPIPAGLRGSPSVSSYLGAAFTTVLTTICSTSMWTSRGGDNHPRLLLIDHGAAATNRKR
ncbi:signal transduction histidine kinase [Cutibacterium acnes JCM 18920]|nr:signal transduction histidine kinase [Cutibacterium acnes JCM 18920]